MLVVGVDDGGAVLGIEADRFASGDRYLLHANNLIRSAIGPDFAPFIEFALKPLEGEEVFVVECLPSPRPVFLKRDGEEAFYVRLGPGSRKLSASEMLAYVQSREAAATDPALWPEPSAPSDEAQLEIMTQLRYQDGDGLFREGDPSTFAILIEEGEVEVLRDVEGQMLSLGRIGAGDSLLLEEGEHLVVAGGTESPYRFRLAVRRKA